jgi:tetratricopeptide (TPR) repeat protein
MHLGFPAEARQIWRAANQPPSEALRICRIADSYAASGDRREALQLYHRAAALDPALAEPFQGQAILHFEAGEAELARDACRQALQRPLPADAREHLQDFAELLQRPATDPVSRNRARLNQGPPGANSRSGRPAS